MKIINIFTDKKAYIPQATAAFWGTYAACSAVMAGGKLWIHLTGSSLKVSELLGTVGTATFRREAAVIALVSFVAFKAINAVLTKTIGTSTNFRAHTIRLISITGGVACGLLTAAAINHATFIYIKIPMAILGIAILTVSCFKKERITDLEKDTLKM